jgi:LPS export ABC transporter protein LptC
MTLRTLTACIAVLMTAACGRESAPAPSMDDVRAEGAPVQESWNVQYYVTETAAGDVASRPRLEIEAVYMATFETEDSTYTIMQSDSAGRTVAHIFDEAGDTSATVYAIRFMLMDGERRLEASGGVFVETPDEKTLRAEHLVWFEEERELRTPGFVRIRTPQERVQGYELVADENLENYTLRRMTGQVTVEEED